MTGRRRPWAAAEQTRLVAGLRAGLPPASLCRELGRDVDDVRAHLAFLLGDPPAGGAGHPTADVGAGDLDLLWLRIRTTSVAPTPLTGAGVATLWQAASKLRLTPEQRAEFERDRCVPSLTALGREALQAGAPQVLAATGLLDLDDWLDAATHLSPDRLRLPAPTDPGWRTRARALLTATIDDIAPTDAREALRRHLTGTNADPGEMTARRRGVLEVARAAGLPNRPASLLRDALTDDAVVGTLTRSLPDAGFAVAVILGILGGRHEPEALRLAGALTSPWHTPPNLGRGVVVRLPRT